MFGKQLLKQAAPIGLLQHLHEILPSVAGNIPNWMLTAAAPVLGTRAGAQYAKLFNKHFLPTATANVHGIFNSLGRKAGLAAGTGVAGYALYDHLNRVGNTNAR